MTHAALLLNDVHVGAQRVAGTTQATAMQVRESLLFAFEAIVREHDDTDLIINGDLLDSFQIPYVDLLGLYAVLRERCERTPRKTFAGRGNHDWSKDSNKLSSFDFLCELLSASHPNFVAVKEPQWLYPGVFMVPHMPNQDLFNIELERLLSEPAKRAETEILLLHANFDNGFAVESDHSLNVSTEQAKALIDRGWRLVFGHEHQGRERFAGKVLCTGNQWPSSVADCQHNPGGKKFAHLITPDLEIEPIQTWQADGDYAEIDWRELSLDTDARFIKVIGKATADEAPKMVDTIAKYRKDSGALVITNGVGVEGMAEMGDIAVSVENIKAFDALGFLLEQLEERQAEVVRGLLERDGLALKVAA